MIIEAGGSKNFLYNIPVILPFLQKTQLDWSYQTVPQQFSCLSLNNNQSNWPRGKIYGGTDSLNNMIYHRGNENDFVGWFENDDYNSTILPYFEKSAKYIGASNLPHKTKFCDSFIESTKEFGETEFHQPKITQKNGQRWSIAHHNYINQRKGHEYLLNTKVIKIIFDKNKKRAIGLDYLTPSKEIKTVYGKNIILSAGVIETPKLLMLSGIGPKEHLSELKIPLIKNLPVGLNLQDHVSTGMDLILLNETLSMSPIEILTPTNLYNYLINEESPLMFPGCEVIGFLKSIRNLTSPDIQFMVLPTGVAADKGVHVKNILNLKEESFNEYFKPLFDKTSISVLSILLHPKSHGFVKLKSNNHEDKPLINPEYLKDPDDVKTITKGLKFIKQLLDTSETLKKFGAEINPKAFPGCENYKIFSDDYWECYIRHFTLTVYHPIGTCKMGDENDSTTVVSKQFKVHGIENLFVCDGSVLPNLSSGNPNAVISMLGFKFLSFL